MKQLGGPRTGKRRRNDGDTGKRFPTSIASTFRAIRQFWNLSTPKRARTADEFVPLFRKAWLKNYAKFPNKSYEEKNDKGYKDFIQKVERGEGELSYFHLRVYASIIEVPTSILMVNSHILGDVAKGYSRDDIMCFLDGIGRSVASVARKIAAMQSDEELNDFVFYRYKRNHSGSIDNNYIGSVALLEMLVEEFCKSGYRG